MADAADGPQMLDRAYLEKVLFSSSTKIRIGALHEIRHKLEHGGE